MKSKTATDVRRFLLILGLAWAILPGWGCNEKGGAEDGLRVMTQNVYYGFDVGPLLGASDPSEIPVLAAQAFQQLLSTDFPGRAEAMADKIALERPHMIGLQEVALIRIQSPGDAVVGGSEPAEAELFDYLGILMAALADRGLDYRVAGKVRNVDVEIPMVTGVDPLTFDDIRLTDFDVVLARSDVAVSQVVAANYEARLFLPTLGLDLPRGFVSVEARLGRSRPVRFVSTHLEDLPFVEIQLAQAEELAGLLVGDSRPVILVGDFNSPAPAGDTFGFLEAQGFADVWSRNGRPGEGEGLTWGHDPDLAHSSDQFTIRIDLIWVRMNAGRHAPMFLGTVSAEVWGDEPDERTASGLWPSDHGGVIATLAFSPGAGHSAD